MEAPILTASTFDSPHPCWQYGSRHKPKKRPLLAFKQADERVTPSRQENATSGHHLRPLLNLCHEAADSLNPDSLPTPTRTRNQLNAYICGTLKACTKPKPYAYTHTRTREGWQRERSKEKTGLTPLWLYMGGGKPPHPRIHRGLTPKQAEKAGHNPQARAPLIFRQADRQQHPKAANSQQRPPLATMRQR